MLLFVGLFGLFLAILGLIQELLLKLWRKK